jgi:polyisoprenoid-binding protein YceI
MIKKLIFALALVPGVATAAPWYIDHNESRIQVEVGYIGNTSLKINFPSFGGLVDFDDSRPQNTDATIKVATTDLRTGIGFMDTMVRSEDYLDARNFPDITFQLDKLVQTSKSTADVFGRITMLGTTRPVIFKATVFKYGPSDRNPNVREAGFNLVTEIDRTQFGSTAGMPDVATKLPVRIRLLLTSEKVS